MSELDNLTVCSKCKSTKMKYRGIRHNKSGDKKYYHCTKCGSYTTLDDGFWKMKYTGEVISAAIELYYSGVSLRETSSLFQRLFGIKFSWVALLAWIKKYSQQVKEFTDMKRPMLSGRWAVDEKIVKIKGKKGYIWLVKDKKRGFVISKVLSDNRKAGNAGKVFRKAKKIGNPKSINHDGYAGYEKKIAKIFPDADDLLSKGFWHRNNNNSLENTNGQFTSRYKTMRGFGDFDSADKILDGWIIDFNFVKRNRTTNKTNAELCKINEVPKAMPWLFMIKRAAYIQRIFSAKF